MDKLAIEDLKRSGISKGEASKAGMYCVEDASEIYEDFQPVKALIIPYYNPFDGDYMEFDRGDDTYPFCRVRYLEAIRNKMGFKKKKMQRYGQPSSSGCFAYFPKTQDIDWQEVADDSSTPIVITEGEKKALVGCLEGYPTIGLGGVHNFMRQGALLPELDKIDWKARPVYICFDSDAIDNPAIHAAEGRLATELSLQRKADIFLVRLPSGPDGAKMGIDDYIEKEGSEAFERCLQGAPKMRKIDTAVVSLNEHVAWIEKEALVYDIRRGDFMKQGSFINGSRYSALSITTVTQKGTLKEVSVASNWLRHPLAQRYDEVVFKPEDKRRVLPSGKGDLALNLWTGFDTAEGDVSPFLALCEFIFKDMEDEIKDIPMKLMAFKAQNPGLKVPLAIMMVGSQGSGKTLWSSCIREAFGDYGVEIAPEALTSQYNGWIEKSLVGVVNEVSSFDVQGKGAGIIRGLISEKKHFMNEKFRTAQQVDSYTQFIMTSNDRGVASFSADDRRMIVVPCPRKHENPAFYAGIYRWKEQGGPKKLMNYLLNYDLKGWRPPSAAPMTAEKYMAYMEGLTPVQRLAEEIRSAKENIIATWIDSALSWASEAAASGTGEDIALARDIESTMPHLQVRPFYTPEELCLMFPAMSAQLFNSPKVKTTPAGEMSRQLRQAGVKYLKNKDDPRGFRYKGMVRQYLIVNEEEEFDGAITQERFDDIMESFPTHKVYKVQQAKKRKNNERA